MRLPVFNAPNLAMRYRATSAPRPHYDLRCGDAARELQSVPSCSVDAIICDPPYGYSDYPVDKLKSMMSAWARCEDVVASGRTGIFNQEWDGCVVQPSAWAEAGRVLKPGGNLFVFAGPRTDDLVSIPIRIAGFERTGAITWIYRNGFPLYADLGVEIDKIEGVESRIIPGTEHRLVGDTRGRRHADSVVHQTLRTKVKHPSKRAASDIGKLASDFRAGLKRAHETILTFRKPAGTSLPLAQIDWGVGGLNIGSVRQTDSDIDQHADAQPELRGRYAADVIGDLAEDGNDYFYQPKASPGEALKYLPAGSTKHPCVKPIDLMRWLVRLAGVRSGGVILDPFMGSGTTGIAAVLEERRFIGIDACHDWVEASRARIEGWLAAQGQGGET